MLKSMFTFKNIAVITLVLFSSLVVLNLTSDGSSSGSCSSDSNDSSSGGCCNSCCSDDDDSSDGNTSGGCMDDGVYTGVKKRDTSPPRPPSTTPSGFDDLRNQNGAVDLPLPDLDIDLGI